jgi:myo-inositol 2-dehydrogenase/D-chiro-inositol 1-dehydrogenase
MRVGLAGVAHVHAPGYVRCLQAQDGAEVAGVWDPDPAAVAPFAHLGQADSLERLLDGCDAVVLAGTNVGHAAILAAAAARGLPCLCEKPVAATPAELAAIEALEGLGRCMAAFPCPFSPVFHRLVETVRAGGVGEVVAVCGTNRGKCPGGWFTDPALSGGGAMVDHTVHVADLLVRLLGARPSWVSAATGSNRLGLGVEDTAMVTLGMPGGVFATIDASWSRPDSYPVWGDVTLAVTGSEGAVEADLFGQGPTVWSPSPRKSSTTSDLDMAMVGEFLSSVREGRPPSVTLEDGLAASRTMLAAYQSAARGGEPVALA